MTLRYLQDCTLLARILAIKFPFGKIESGKYLTYLLVSSNNITVCQLPVDSVTYAQ